MSILDSQRFGTFEYASFSDVKDFRIERYLPTQATDITLNKYASGHRAKYSISQTELTDYLDELWNQYGEYSAVPRNQLNDGAEVSADLYASTFDDLGWSPLGNAIQFHSPVQADGGGATYYFDSSAGTTYHRAGYW